jgi:predicted RecA/RadA family phage recombinase
MAQVFNPVVPKCVILSEGWNTNIAYTPVSDVAYGDVIILGGSIFAFAPTDIPAGVRMSLRVFAPMIRLPKGSGAISQGDVLYWDANNNQATKTSSGNVRVGICANDAASGDANVSLFVMP